MGCNKTSASTINDPFRDLHGDEPSVRGSVAYFRSKGSWRCDWPNSKIQKISQQVPRRFICNDSSFAFTTISFLIISFNPASKTTQACPLGLSTFCPLAWSLESPPSVPVPLLLGSAVTFPGTLGPHPYPWLSSEFAHLSNLAALPQIHATDQADPSVQSTIHICKVPSTMLSKKYFCPHILCQGPLSLALAREVQGLQKRWQRQFI